MLFASLTLLRVAAAMAGFAPQAMLGEGVLGLASLAVGGALLVALGLVGSLFARVGAWRRGALLLVGAWHVLTVVLFPPGWVIAAFEEPDVAFRIADPRPGAFALTIDDGLDAEVTPRLLEVLRRHDARATFFVLGETLDTLPDLARRCLVEGHELANHQMTDTPSVALPPDELERRIEQAHERLGALTETRWFRPGGGLVTERCRTVCERLGLRIVLGSVFPFDSHVASAEFHAAYLAGRVEPGAIVVLHDGGDRGRRAARALDAALPKLAERGLRAVPLGEVAAR